MALLTTPVCEFGKKAIDFSLRDPAGKEWTLAQVNGAHGLLVMFICNHCPYVKAILPDLVQVTDQLKQAGVNTIAIMANDWHEYPEDAPENMAKIAIQEQFNFPYVLDATQQVAKAYGAVCTPDFFGYNHALTLQYRGRFDARGMKNRSLPLTECELLQAMLQVAAAGTGPALQHASMGCSIKWSV